MENETRVTQPDHLLDGQAIFMALRDVLADLYPEERDARVVAADAGLGTQRIAFDPRAQTNWHHILTEAVQATRVDALWTVVLSAYGEYEPL